jgi:hypothetical protein
MPHCNPLSSYQSYLNLQALPTGCVWTQYEMRSGKVELRAQTKTSDFNLLWQPCLLHSHTITPSCKATKRDVMVFFEDAEGEDAPGFHEFLLLLLAALSLAFL